MTARQSATDFVGRFVPDDQGLRREFDRRLGSYVRRFHDHWDVGAVIDVLHDLEGRVDEAAVRLERARDGHLTVTVNFVLPPHPCDLAATDTRRGG